MALRPRRRRRCMVAHRRRPAGRRGVPAVLGSRPSRAELARPPARGLPVGRPRRSSSRCRSAGWWCRASASWPRGDRRLALVSLARPPGHLRLGRRRRSASRADVDVVVLVDRVPRHPRGRRAVHQRHRVVRAQARAGRGRGRVGPRGGRHRAAGDDDPDHRDRASAAAASATDDVGIGAILGAPFMLSTLAMFVTGVGVLALPQAPRRPARAMLVDTGGPRPRHPVLRRRLRARDRRRVPAAEPARPRSRSWRSC